MKTLKLKELKEGNIYKCLLSGRNVLAYHNEGSKQSEYACGETYHAFTGLIWDESECHYKQIELEDDVLVELNEHKTWHFDLPYNPNPQTTPPLHKFTLDNE